MATGKGTLKGKVAIITGGGTGLGRAMARSLAREGADVVVAARRVEPIEVAAKEVRGLGGRGLAISTDVTDSGQVDRMAERTLSEMGRIDILINNAGLVRGEQRKPIWEVTDEEWHRGMDANLTGAFYCCRAVGRHLVEQRSGKVINVSSVYALRGGRDNYMYCCAKGGIVQLTRSLALTWARDNVQVNCLIPGFVDTRALQPERRERPREGYRGMAVPMGGELIPLGRVGAPADIASLGLFLASDASDYITGEVFACDGGALLGGHAPTGYAPVIGMKEGWRNL